MAATHEELEAILQGTHAPPRLVPSWSGETKRGPSAGAYLLVSVFVVVVAMTAIGTVLSIRDLDHAQTRAGTSATFVSKLASSDVAKAIGDAKQVVVTTAAQPGLAQVLAAPSGCQLLGGGSGLFRSGRLDVITPGGVVECSSSAAALAPDAENYASVSWLRSVAGAAKAPIASPIFTDPITQKGSLAIAAPVFDGKRYVGAFVDVLELDGLADEMARVYGGPQGYEFIVVDTATRDVISASAHAGVRTGDVVPRELAPVTGTWNGTDGAERLYGSTPVEAYRWRTLAVRDSSRALAGWRGAVRRQAMSGGIALALLGVLALVLQRRVLGPLRRLQVAVGSNGNGFKTLPVQVEGPSEIEQLAVEFNSMSSRTRAEGIQNAHLAAASHELRGPLNVVIGMADTMIERDGQIDDEVRSQLLRRISSSGKKMDRILTDLFEVMRQDDGPERLDRTPVDLEALARKTVEDAEGLEGRTVEIEASGVVGDLDARMVARILDNLVTNAARHAGPTSRIWVNVSDCADGVTIAVDDEGPGVPAEDRARIFERFERGTGVAVSGLGIGLSVVSRFAQLHGGRAWVEDRPGGGASFRVFLPRASS